MYLDLNMEDETDDGHNTCSYMNKCSLSAAFHESEDMNRLLTEGTTEELFGDFDTLMKNKPDWIDPIKLKRGQKFAMDNYFGIAYSEVLSLYMVFAITELGLDTLIYTRQSDSPYKAYRRYYTTTDIVKSWLETDILTSGTKGNDNLRKVYRMHRKVQKDLQQLPKDKMKAKCAILGNSMCPALSKLQKDFEHMTTTSTEIKNLMENCKTSFNQFSLAITQWGFVGLAVTYPERFGIHTFSKQDMEDFLHVWRIIGYYMGVKDEYNFCRGTYDEVIERSRWFIKLMLPKFREVAEKWEHMSRCVAEGVRMYAMRMSFETSFCYLCNLLGLNLINFKKSLSIKQHFYVWLLGFTLNYMLRYDTFKCWMNRRVLNRLNIAAINFNDAEFQKQLKNKTFNYENNNN